MSRSGPAFAPAILTVLLFALTGCDGGAVFAPTPTPTPSETYAVTGDGVLRIGTLFASSGTEAAFGPAQVAAVEAAVREINELGGIGDVPVEVLHRNGSAETAESGFEDLVARGVDVVIGPAAPEVADSLADVALAASVAIVSPAARLPELQGAALAAALSEEESTKVAYLHLEGESEEALLDSLTSALDEGGGEVVYSSSFTSDTTDFASLVSKAKKAKPDAVIVVTPAAAATQTAVLVTALGAAGLGGEKLWLTSGNLAAYSQVPATALAGANGIRDGAQPDAAFVARLRQADPSIADTLYAAEAYDATILAALAVAFLGDDGGPAIARTLSSVSAGGIKCTSYGACLDVLETEEDIDYDGVSGLGFTDTGALRSGSFGVFTYSDASTYALRNVLVAG